MIHQILHSFKKKRINFFIDLMSISKGFYNKDVVLVEIGRYATEGKPSQILIEELKEFLNNLYFQFKIYDPFFILFYDDGICTQQTAIDSTYKSGTNSKLIVDHDNIELFRQVKKHYFKEIEEKFNKKDLSKVYYLKEYEADFIPYYCIINNFYDSFDDDVLNIILSVDKDLLQCCEFTNTIQCITSFVPSKEGRFQIQFDAYDKDNAICYLKDTLKRGILTAKYVPMLLAIAGDKADEIKGIKKGLGPKHAFELIVDYSIPYNIDGIRMNLNNMPDVIVDNFKKLEKNYKMISFEEQVKRVPERAYF